MSFMKMVCLHLHIRYSTTTQPVREILAGDWPTASRTAQIFLRSRKRSFLQPAPPPPWKLLDATAWSLPAVQKLSSCKDSAEAHLRGLKQFLIYSAKAKNSCFRGLIVLFFCFFHPAVESASTPKELEPPLRCTLNCPLQQRSAGYLKTEETNRLIFESSPYCSRCP